MRCEQTTESVGPRGAGVVSGSEYLTSMECGPRRKAFVDTQYTAPLGCRNYLVWCPLAPGAQIDPTKQIVVYQVYATATRTYLRTEIGCDVGLGPAPPTMAAIRDAVTRHAPPPATHSGGTRYLIRAAVVFSTTGPGGRALTDVTIPRFPLAGHTLTARLHLTRTDWAWGDGTTTTYTTGSLVGHPYTDADPCTSTTTCPGYLAHVYTTTGTRTVTVTASWTATVTLDGTPTQIPVTGGVTRPDPTGRTITLHQAHTILVTNP